MVVYKDGQCVQVPDPEEVVEKRPKKRPVTTRMIEANRRNSKKSTGPTTESGKSVSRFNGVRHGQASLELHFLPNEDRAAFFATVDRWCEQRGVTTEDEYACVVNAVFSQLVKSRTTKAQVLAITERIDEINDHFAEQKAAKARDMLDNLKARPWHTVMELMNLSAGCSLLINEFTALKERLTTHYAFEVTQREQAIRLGGHRPKELFTDKVVMEINRSYLGALKGSGGFNAAQAANALMYDRPKEISKSEFERKLETLVSALPTIEAGHAKLQKYVDRWISKLTKRRKLMKLREAREKQTAIGMAPCEVSHEGQLRSRYLTQADRTFNAALKMMLTLKADRRKYGPEVDDPAPAPVASPDADGAPAPGDVATEPERAVTVSDPPAPADVASPAPEVASGPIAIDPEPMVLALVNVEKPSEAVTTQVVAPIAGNDPIPAAPAGLDAAASLIEPDPLVDVIERFQREIARLREYDHLE
jgi:hypothetical protein